MNGWDELRVSEMMYNEFLKEGKISSSGMYDARVYASMIFDDPYYRDQPRIYDQTYQNVFGDDDKTEVKYCFKKFLPYTLEEYNQSTTYTNIPLMRYSNVMLMTAEALNELGGARRTDAIKLIDNVRRVHGHMPPMNGTEYDDIKAQIEHERLVEFAVECFRFYDLRRWGKLEEAMKADGRTNFDVAEDGFLPIPLMEIQSNNSLRK